ncbi:N-carbamoyl-L-amino-acid hydrolase [Sulfobacillus thermosulfidooxidans DSM 9293]|uniref:N-carbamoyl-L-amino-acid hydrolase n=2 Tax=Sulfobacillus thermosulfidooxidans TaxID=28034 RepID=A0A1W1WHX4_SULTA|nr:Zn-dependent hydrolase [Sulfobacillus thermosulfidooxidans]PSR24905.1 MAG: Zn-dependent hydrolase [Sulfobacillus thermosulfidooxidans]SMC05749.1 N-carbamoyl-L-amino-acid hydrolase [Sulfobacillus thermosulfidooxidans DSM 9293]
MPDILASSRLQRRLDALAAIGRDDTGGITRPFGSAAERAARQWFLGEAEKAGLVTRTDPAGNLWALFPGASLDIVAVGSHLDTVVHGGAYDGALGVLLGLEALQTLQEEGYRPHHTLAVLALTGEEPNPFRLSTLGSRLLTGILSWDTVLEVTDETGYSVREALHQAGAPALHDPGVHMPHLKGFFEPHIEQGPRLHEAGLPVGVVSTITGITRQLITLTGEQNHAGTTPYVARRDAVQGFAQAMVLFQELSQQFVDRAVGTVGYVRVFPNSINIVPSRVEFMVEWRAPQLEILAEVTSTFWQRLQALGSRLHLSLTREIILDQAPSPMDEAVQALLHGVIEEMGVPHPTMVSWAGHDAAHLAKRVPTGMLFVRSNGYSHCPDESANTEDIMLAAEIVRRALMRWDAVASRNAYPLFSKDVTGC